MKGIVILPYAILTIHEKKVLAIHILAIIVALYVKWWCPYKLPLLISRESKFSTESLRKVYKKITSVNSGTLADGSSAVQYCPIWKGCLYPHNGIFGLGIKVFVKCKSWKVQQVWRLHELWKKSPTMWYSKFH